MLSTRVFHKAEEDQKDIFGPVADLMVGVVFIFIILILALSLDLASEKMVPQSTYDAEVARNKKLEDTLRSVRDSQILPLMQQLAEADQTRTAILRDMQQRLSALGIDVQVNPDAGTLMLPSSKLFASGQADPMVPEGRDTILHLGQVMSDVLPCYAPNAANTVTADRCPAKRAFNNLSAVYLEGHTDVFPYGSFTGRFRNNWDLSAGRAIEAFTLIRDHYEQLRTLKNQDGEAVLGVSGYADTRPALREAADRTLPAVADKDRRIEVRLVMSTNQEVVGAVLKELSERLKSIDELIH
jgi:chemotaxis protein MotB